MHELTRAWVSPLPGTSICKSYRAKLHLAKLSSKVVELTHLPECFGILLAATLVAY